MRDDHGRPREPVDGLPDAVLCARAIEGSTRAFETLLQRYRGRMYALAVRTLGPVGDPDAVVQEAFLSAWRTLPGYRGDAAFATWLYRIVVNRALTELRRNRPSDPLPDDGAQLAAPLSAGPEASAQSGALADALADALARLPDDLRVAWLLREVDDRSYEEVAAIAGTSVSTARGRISRARTRLAQLMEPWR